MIVNGDSREVLAGMIERGETVHSIVTDPPYGLVSVVKRFGKADSAPAKSEGPTGVYSRASANFIGQTWDATGIEQDPTFWRLCLDVLKPGGYLLAFGGTRTWHRIACAIEDAVFEVRDSLMWLFGTGMPKSHQHEGGRGTNLKPAWEPIIVARKAITGTIAATIEQHGTGALNIEASRTNGRWPANLIGGDDLPQDFWRFFYTTKASKKDRNSDWQGNPLPYPNAHPTVKPADLMQWLVRLVTPPGGTVLDPFAGSGSTGVAARREGFRFIGIEQDPRHADFAAMRVGGSDFEGRLAHLREAIRRNTEARNG